MKLVSLAAGMQNRRFSASGSLFGDANRFKVGSSCKGRSLCCNAENVSREHCVGEVKLT